MFGTTERLAMTAIGIVCVCVCVCVVEEHMTIESKVTLKAVLLKIHEEMGYEYSGESTMHYRDFKRIIMIDSDFTTQDRVCRLRWKDLTEMGYARKVNKSKETIILRFEVIARDLIKWELIPKPKIDANDLVISEKTTEVHS